MTKKISSSLIKIMSSEEIEKEFIPQLTQATKDLFRILEEFLKPGKTPKRELSFALMKEVNEVETFLDDYGASQNKKFFYFRELVASIRWINIAFFQGLHILARIKNYKLEISNEERENFIKDLKKNINFYLNSLKNLTKELKKEASKLGIKRSKSSFSLNILLPPIQKKILPPDLNEGIVKEEIERIFEILVKFLQDSESFNMFVCRVEKDDEISEEILEKYRSIFNQLESLYDTYIKNTEIENIYSDLKKVRSHIAITLHLLEIGKALAHFYERHSDEVRKYDTAIKIGKLVNKNKVKESIRKFVFSSSLLFTVKGKDLCRKIFTKLGRDADEFIIETKMLILPSHRIEDFHIRPVMPVTQIANKYVLDTYLYFNRRKYNLKSAIEMAIAIPDIRDALANENVEIMIQGSKKAVEEIFEFFRDRCGAFEKEIECEILKDLT